MLALLKKYSVLLHRVLTWEEGGIAVYTAFFAMLAVGAGALVLDVGRMGVLRAQMQNRADAGAMAGAVQLDGRAGARDRAAAVAVNAMAQASGIPGDGAELAVEAVNFFSEIEPAPVAAAGDEDAVFIEVVLEPRQVDFLFEPVLDATVGAHSTSMQARAVATVDPFICHAPPLMLCDPGEADSSLDPALPENAGRQILLKPPPSGGSAWTPGNYGLLALPDGSLGASDIEGALAAVEPEDCYDLDVTTAPGVKTNKVKNGVNARFDLPGGLPWPAPNVINYPKDPEIEDGSAAMIGSGDWDIAGYWADRHGGSPPGDLDGASRYQVYLFELGLEFARQGRRTVYPVDGEVPAGFTLVSPPAPDIPTDPANPDDPDFDGEPGGTVAANGPARRLVSVAVLQCEAEGVRGSHSYPTNGNYLEMFITEAVDDAPVGGIYGEIVRPLTAFSDPDFHANVKLAQ